MIHFNWLIILFYHCYKFNVIEFCSNYKHKVLYSKDWWLFKNLDWWRITGFCSHNFLLKVAKSLYVYQTTPDEVQKYVQLNSSDNCIHHYNVEILNIFDPELELINTKPIIKNKLKEFLAKLKKFKVQQY